MQAKLPNLSRLTDISEFIEGAYAGGASDSEPEDDDSKVALPEAYSGRGNSKAQLSSIRLHELGPRLVLSLTKVERGLASGDVLYHSFISKVCRVAVMLART